MDDVYVETWQKLRCPKCEVVNWISQGNVEDLTVSDTIGVRCHACGHQFLLCDPEIPEDEIDYTVGLPAPR